MLRASAMSIWNFFKYKSAESKSDADTETVRKITAKLDALPADEARHLASFAYLLGRVANADRDISDVEIRTMENLVRAQGKLSEDLAVLVVQIARSQNLLFGHTENYLVAREFREVANRDQRLALLRCLFAVAAADENVSLSEDNEVRRISQELQLSHEDFIAARLEVRDYLSTRKKET
jgi:uncharacterized tellurite resistance protein B-like protein